MELRPSEIYFTQNSVSSTFGRCTQHKGRSIGHTLDDLVNGKCSISDIPKMSVMQENGKWLTADNRRLWIFRYLEKLNKCFKIPVDIVYSIDSRKRNSTNGGTDVSIFRGRDPGGCSWQKVNSIKIPNFIGKVDMDISNILEILENKKWETEMNTPPTFDIALKRTNGVKDKEMIAKKQDTNENKMTFVNRCGEWAIKKSLNKPRDTQVNIIGTSKLSYREKLLHIVYPRHKNDLCKSITSTSVLHEVRNTAFKSTKKRGILKKRIPQYLERYKAHKSVAFGGSFRFVYHQEGIGFPFKKIKYKYARINYRIDNEYICDVHQEYYHNDNSKFAIEPSEYMECPESFDRPEQDEWIDYEIFRKKISNVLLRNWGKDIAYPEEDSDSSETDSHSSNDDTDDSDSFMPTVSDDYENMYCSSDSDESDGKGFMYYEQEYYSNSIDYEQWNDHDIDSDSDSERLDGNNLDHDSETQLGRVDNKSNSGTRILEKIQKQTDVELDNNVCRLKCKNDYDYSSDDFTDSEYGDNSLLNDIYADGLYDSSDTENMVFDYLE